MERRSRINRGLALAVCASLVVHAALLTAWMRQRSPPPPEAPVFSVTLVRPAPQEPPPETKVPRLAAKSPAPVSAANPVRVAAPRPSAEPVAGLQAETPPVTKAGPASAAAPLPSLAGLGRALAARSRCRDQDGLTEAEKRDCAERIMAAPEHRPREMNPYVRIEEHVTVMAGVRRAENTGYRMSCERMRNLDSTCPNLLPDNKPEDYERPKD